MAKRRSSNYKQVVTGTKDMGVIGAQVHIGKVEKLDPALKGAYINNFIVSCMTDRYADEGGTGGFMVYLSTAPSGSWSDDAVISARATPSGGGNVSLQAKRRILTDDSTDLTGQGPVHVWAEMTDLPEATQNARFTIEAWGKMIRLSGDFAA